MPCGISCLCSHIVLSQDVSFENGVLKINLPSGSYENRERYCIVVAQDIPEDTTISADVVCTIGDDTDTTYPLTNANCTNLQAYQLQPRVKYPTVVSTNIGTGVFKLINNIGCIRCNNSSSSLPVSSSTTTTTTTQESDT